MASIDVRELTQDEEIDKIIFGEGGHIRDIYHGDALDLLCGGCTSHLQVEDIPFLILALKKVLELRKVKGV